MDYQPESLYDLALADREGSNPYPPGTMKTASIETIDNDVAYLMLDAGVIR